MKRTPFGEAFEGKTPGIKLIPLVTLRRLTEEEEDKYQICRGDHVGVFNDKDLLAFLSFDDLFDADGNRFYND